MCCCFRFVVVVVVVVVVFHFCPRSSKGLFFCTQCDPKLIKSFRTRVENRPIAFILTNQTRYLNTAILSVQMAILMNSHNQTYSSRTFRTYFSSFQLLQRVNNNNDYYATAGSNFTLVRFYQVSPRQQDAAQGGAWQKTGIGIRAQATSAFLSDQADVFRFRRPGFEHVEGSLALESQRRPGFYLRHKNYKFHLQKALPTGMYGKCYC